MQIKDIQQLIEHPSEPNGSKWAMDAEDILDEMDLLTPENKVILTNTQILCVKLKNLSVKI
jgi:hypothetical protein